MYGKIIQFKSIQIRLYNHLYRIVSRYCGFGLAVSLDLMFDEQIDIKNPESFTSGRSFTPRLLFQEGERKKLKFKDLIFFFWQIDIKFSVIVVAKSIPRIPSVSSLVST